MTPDLSANESSDSGSFVDCDAIRFASQVKSPIRRQHHHLLMSFISLHNVDCFSINWPNSDSLAALGVSKLGVACDPLPTADCEDPTPGVGHGQ